MDLRKAVEKFSQAASFVGSEIVSLEESLGRISAKTIKACHANPPFPCSRWDGFAFNAHEVSKAVADAPVSISIDRSIVFTAGMQDFFSVKPGRCYAIMTGAPVVAGLNAVIKVEDAEITGNKLIFKESVRPFSGVLLEGALWGAGEVLAARGDRLIPTSLFLLAEDGVSHVDVFCRPRVAVIAVGNELVMPGNVLSWAKKYGGVQYLIGSTAESFGLTPLYGGIIPDELGELKKAFFREKEREVNLIVTIGGTGKGVKDLVFKAWEEVGAEFLFTGVNIIPGKSAFGGVWNGLLWLALSGGGLGALAVFLEFLDGLFCKWFDSSCVMPVYEARLNDNLDGALGYYNVFVGKAEHDEGTLTFNIAAKGKNNFYDINSYVIIGPDVERAEAGSVGRVKVFL